VQSTAFLIFAVIAIAFQTLMIILFFFEPVLAYKITKTPSIPPESKQFGLLIETIAQSTLLPGNKVEVLTTGYMGRKAILGGAIQCSGLKERL
jgi:hypothetical protein